MACADLVRTGDAARHRQIGSAEPGPSRLADHSRFTCLTVSDYDLAATLEGGQAFRWQRCAEGWAGVVQQRWVRLARVAEGIFAETAEATSDWSWLAKYLGTDEQLTDVLATFPADRPLQSAVTACRGLRLLRQEPWECLASFVLSSTKQIVQIQQIIGLLCERFGEPVPVPAGHRPAFAFPTAERLAAVPESELRACKMGFRARYLRAVAARIAEGRPDLRALPERPLAEARAALLELPGVGPKIANCALLFSLGFRRAFPLDVWVLKALRQLYFPRRRVTVRGLQEFSDTHFGPNGGYAQQYLFHHMRQRAGRAGRVATPIPRA